MKLLLVSYLLGATSILAFGQSKQPDTASVEKTLMQIENDWNKAAASQDTATVEKHLADDWVGIDSKGKAVTRMQLIAELKSTKYSIQSFEMAPMKVRIFGDTAVVTGGHIEKGRYLGKETSSRYVWTDLFVNRNGRWRIVASHLSQVEN